MAYIDIKDLKIDKEFESLLPVLTPEELEKLDRLQAEIKTTIKEIIAEGGMTND